MGNYQVSVQVMISILDEIFWHNYSKVGTMAIARIYAAKIIAKMS